MARYFMPVWLIALTILITLPAWAIEYRLQVVNVPFLTLSAHEGPAGDLSRLEARLDAQEFSANAVIPGREVVLLQDPRYGGTIPARLSILPATRDQAWTTLVWDANPGDTFVFQVGSDMVAWQHLRMLAANPEGRLRRMVIGNPSIFGGYAYEAPTVSSGFLANAVDQGTFPTWMARNARTINGMTTAIGRGQHTFYTVDRLYVVLTMPAEPRVFKVAIGWQDRDDRGTGGNQEMVGF